MRRALVLSLALMLSLMLGGGIGLGLASPATAETRERIISESKFELFVHDSAASAAFYRALGFEIAHRKPDGYTTLTSGSTVIALSPLPWWLPMHWFGWLRHPPLGTEIVLYTQQLERAHARLENSGYSPGTPAVQAWGDRDFRIRDPDGYYVRVTGGRAVPQPASDSGP